MKNLIPKINGTYIEHKGYFELPQVLRVSDRYPVTNKIFAERLGKIGAYEIEEDKINPLLQTEDAPDYEKEEYALMIRVDSVKIFASCEHGYSNALVTLYQLLAKGNGKTACGMLWDKPKYERRGFMLDCCRHFFPVEDVKKILEYCACLKLNSFHWHLSEDQGYRIESKRFPKLNEIASFRKLGEADPLVTRGKKAEGELYGGYYTHEEIRDLVSFAAERQIEVFPEIDLPGHSVALLAAYPELSCSKESCEVENKFGIFEHVFCAGKEETYVFLFALLDEVSELFPSPYFHLGGDEVPKAEWKKCPDCNRIMKKQGFTDYEQLQAYFTGRMTDHLKEKGKIPVVWNEAAAGGNLEESAVLQYWIEEKGQNYTGKEIQKGRKFILSNVYSFYCDHSYERVPLKETLLYEPQIQGEPIPKENILGMEAPMWTEYVPYVEDMEKLINPRLLAVAENGWTKERDYEGFMERLEMYQSCKTLNNLKEWSPGEQIGVTW